MLSPSDNIERYELLGELATGGMATVYLGRQRGALGFSRTVAIKSMHPQLAKDPAFRAMFIDEAHLTARIRHPNVVPTLDIVQSESKLLLIMEYVEGVSLSVLLKEAKARGMHLPARVVAAIVHDVLEGLHAAHELRDENGQPLGVVHRDVSPQNILVGVDGVARVVDFGVAKATGRSYKTQTGEIRGKVGYMAPEQMFGEELDRRVDVYASGVVLWEALAGERLFNAPTDAALVLLVTKGTMTPPSVTRGERLPEGLDQLVERALAQDPAARFATTAEMSRRLTEVVKPASRDEVGQLVRGLCPQETEARARFFKSPTPSSPSFSASVMNAESKAVLEVLTRATMSREVSSVDAIPQRGVPVRLSVLAIMAILSTGFLFYALYAGRLQASAPPVTAIAAPEPEPPPAVTVPPAPAPPPPPPAPSAAPVAKPAKHKPAPKPPAKDCTPPYTTDAAGNRHYKPECI
ncbi:MAG: serine/threonine protein kinase [Labilithrix sp.]|nr:serine/threonine protein kinase [Labilithrix sp.]MCW5815031.1 serine/threonine protein kinase [Labilithrix sp.]